MTVRPSDQNESTVADLRALYRSTTLDEKEVATDPIEQFRHWYEHALLASLPQPDAMTLATASAAGRPSARIVLLKGFDQTGFRFFSNYRSRKGRELASNPWASLLIHWIELDRAVRIEGTVRKVVEQESDAYFATRPLGSQLGAWVSPQSEVIGDRAWLEQRLADAGQRYADRVPRPPHWGGYVLKPASIEFWQGRRDRLHDRIQYRRQPDDAWIVERLAP